MVSIDTNVAIRLLVNDDPDQTKRVVALFKSHQIYITKTVALETEWVLRGVYNLDRKRVNAALTALFSLEQMQVEDAANLFAALDAHANGVDFADALHITSSQRADTFATFDEALRARSKKLQLQPPVISP
jgi:predicted nucleic-acid-binding protein